MGTLRTVGLVLAVAILVGVGGAFYAGIIPSDSGVEEPSVRVADIGDWGTVTDSQVELIHTLTVQNPNPVEVQVGDDTTLNLGVELNGVRLGSVEKSGLDIQEGNNTVQVASELNQNQLGEFWASFINQNETIHAVVTPELVVDRGPGFTVSGPPARVSALTDERPVSDAMNQAGTEMEGTYTKTVRVEAVDTQYLSNTDLGPGDEATIGYTLENVAFEFGDVSADQTELLIHLRVRNDGETRQPGVPDGVAIDTLMNDIEVVTARSDAVSVRSIDRDAVLAPGETESYTLVATADNDNIEEWFTTYAAQNETSSIRGELEFYFELGDARISLPEDGAVAYECGFQTGIFVDGQNTSTTCGSNGTVEIGPTNFEQSELSGDSSDDESPGPTAVAAATPTSGDAPLEVTFDGSDSTASETEIREYGWRFDDGSAPQTGAEVTHTFRTAGEYTVELVVTDSQGNTDTTTVTVQVDAGSSSPPTAVADATPTSGEAPLEVTFDASGSSDPDGDIVEYLWRFGDGSPPASGATVTHTFQTADEYTVELVVVDAQGNRDTDTVTVSVSSRVG